MNNRIRFSSARQVVDAFPAAADDLGEAPEGISPLSHVTSLRALLNPAIGLLFTALMLPKRESVWWGCLCIRGMKLDGLETRAGLEAAEAWVRQPEEDQRRAAGELAMKQNFNGAGAWIAFAAFTSGGSLAPAGLQTVPPPPDSCGRSVYAAVLQATKSDDPLQRIANIRCALDSARDFSSGGDGIGPWREGPKIEPLPVEAGGE